MVSAGVLAVLGFNVLLLGGALAIAAYLVLDRRPAGGRSEGARVANWHAEAASLAMEVRAAAEALESGSEDVSRRLLPLATRLRSHARSAPPGADGYLVKRLHDLGTRCYEIGMEHTTDRAVRTGVFLEDRLERLDDDAAAFLEDVPGK